MDRLPNFLRFPYWPEFEPGPQMKQEPLSAAYISLKKVFLLRADDLLQLRFATKTQNVNLGRKRQIVSSH